MKLIRLRYQKNKSRKQTAKEIGISDRALQQFEAGEKQGRLEKAMKIAKYYNINITDIDEFKNL